MTKDLEILAASQWDETSRAVELPWFHVGQLLSGDLILQNLQKLRIGSPTCANIDGEYLLCHDVLRHHKSVNWGQQVEQSQQQEILCIYAMLQVKITTYYNLKYSYIPSMSMHMRHHSSRVPNLNLRYIISNSAQQIASYNIRSGPSKPTSLTWRMAKLGIACSSTVIWVSDDGIAGDFIHHALHQTLPGAHSLLLIRHWGFIAHRLRQAGSCAWWGNNSWKVRALSARLISAFIVTYFLVFLNLSHHKNLWESKNIPPNLLVAAEVAVVLHLSSIEDLGGSREVFSTQPPSQGWVPRYHGSIQNRADSPSARDGQAWDHWLQSPGKGEMLETNLITWRLGESREYAWVTWKEHNWYSIHFYTYCSTINLQPKKMPYTEIPIYVVPTSRLRRPRWNLVFDVMRFLTKTLGAEIGWRPKINRKILQGGSQKSGCCHWHHWLPWDMAVCQNLVPL